MNSKNSDIVIVIPAHDSYKDIVLVWCQALKKFWANCPYHIIWANETETLNSENVTVFHSGVDSTFWSRVLNVLEHIDAKYVLIWSEDYILTQQIDEDRISEIISFMEETKSIHCRLIPLGKVEMKKLPIKKLYKMDPQKAYALSTNVGIFSKDFLLSVARKEWSGWDLEKYFLGLSQRGECFGCLYDDSNNGKMVHLVKQGLMFPGAVKALNRAGFVYYGNREIMSYHQSLIFNLTTFVSGICPSHYRSLLKSVAKKLGLKFVTD